MNSQRNRNFRVGQIVPSSNTTMETEIPAMLRAHESVAAERFTFHSSRMRMKKVVKEELEAMDRDSDRFGPGIVVVGKGDGAALALAAFFAGVVLCIIDGYGAFVHTNLRCRPDERRRT